MQLALLICERAGAGGIVADRDSTAGLVGLAEAIEALREELYVAMISSSKRELRFRAPSVELTIEAAVTKTTDLKSGVKWWVVEAGAGFTRESVTTQTLKIVLEPVQLDSNGGPFDALISGSRKDDDEADPFADPGASSR